MAKKKQPKPPIGAISKYEAKLDPKVLLEYGQPVTSKKKPPPVLSEKDKLYSELYGGTPPKFGPKFHTPQQHWLEHPKWPSLEACKIEVGGKLWICTQAFIDMIAYLKAKSATHLTTWKFLISAATVSPPGTIQTLEMTFSFPLIDESGTLLGDFVEKAKLSEMTPSLRQHILHNLDTLAAESTVEDVVKLMKEYEKSDYDKDYSAVEYAFDKWSWKFDYLSFDYSEKEMQQIVKAFWSKPVQTSHKVTQHTFKNTGPHEVIALPDHKPDWTVHDGTTTLKDVIEKFEMKDELEKVKKQLEEMIALKDSLIEYAQDLETDVERITKEKDQIEEANSLALEKKGKEIEAKTQEAIEMIAVYLSGSPLSMVSKLEDLTAVKPLSLEEKMVAKKLAQALKVKLKYETEQSLMDQSYSFMVSTSLLPFALNFQVSKEYYHDTDNPDDLVKMNITGHAENFGKAIGKYVAQNLKMKKMDLQATHVQTAGYKPVSTKW